jgi:hypothetical protein
VRPSAGLGPDLFHLDPKGISANPKTRGDSAARLVLRIEQPSSLRREVAEFGNANAPPLPLPLDLRSEVFGPNHRAIFASVSKGGPMDNWASATRPGPLCSENPGPLRAQGPPAHKVHLAVTSLLPNRVAEFAVTRDAGDPGESYAEPDTMSSGVPGGIISSCARSASCRRMQPWEMAAPVVPISASS